MGQFLHNVAFPLGSQFVVNFPGIIQDDSLMLMGIEQLHDPGAEDPVRLAGEDVIGGAEEVGQCPVGFLPLPVFDDLACEDRLAETGGAVEPEQMWTWNFSYRSTEAPSLVIGIIKYPGGCTRVVGSEDAFVAGRGLDAGDPGFEALEN